MKALEDLERYYGPDLAGSSPFGKASGRDAQRSASDGDTPGTDGQASTSAVDDEAYITHLLTKSDTLAGLAVQYNVAVSDIKRANGLMSENMMWCRSKLLIPRRSIPLTDEQQRRVAELVAGADPIDSSRRRLKEHIRGAAEQRAEGMSALDKLNSYYDLGDGTREWGSPTVASLGGGEVEMGVLSAGESSLMAPSLHDDRVRLRGRRATDMPQTSDTTAFMASADLYPCATCLPQATGSGASRRLMKGVRSVFGDLMEPPAGGVAHASRPAPPHPSSAASAQSSGGIPRVRSSNGVSAFLSKISAAASQPALSGGGPSVGAIGQGLLPPRAPATEPRTAHMRREGSSASVAASTKGGKGD